jgi:multidrug resistance protein, MATE family
VIRVLKSHRLVIPVVGSYSSDVAILLIELAFLGHMGDAQLAGAAIGISLFNVTGGSIILGILSALDTLTAQAYGAEQYHKIGIALQQSFFITTIYSLFLFPLWMVRV